MDMVLGLMEDAMPAESDPLSRDGVARTTWLFRDAVETGNADAWSSVVD